MFKLEFLTLWMVKYRLNGDSTLQGDNICNIRLLSFEFNKLYIHVRVCGMGSVLQRVCDGFLSLERRSISRHCLKVLRKKGVFFFLLLAGGSWEIPFMPLCTERQCVPLHGCLSKHFKWKCTWHFRRRCNHQTLKCSWHHSKWVNSSSLSLLSSLCEADWR